MKNGHVKLAIFQMKSSNPHKIYCILFFFRLEKVFRVKVHITGENCHSQLNEKAIIIMNHRTRLDWLFFWSVIMRQKKLQYEKIVLKDGLKHIPGAGKSCTLLVS